MILVNGQKAILRQFNRCDTECIFDDKNYKEIYIKCVPFDVDEAIRFGIYTTPEAKGYYQVGRLVDVKIGDQIIFIGKFKNKNIDLSERTLTVQAVYDNWLFNRVENKIIMVK